MAIIKRRDKITGLTKQRIYYSDVPSNFSILFGTQDLDVATNEDAIKQSVVNLLLTNRGERLFKPTIGSDIRSALFENMDPAVSEIIRGYITTTIEQYEPRANLLNVDVEADPDTNALVATVVFSILNKTEPITLNVLLNRIR